MQDMNRTYEHTTCKVNVSTAYYQCAQSKAQHHHCDISSLIEQLVCLRRKASIADRTAPTSDQAIVDAMKSTS